jgi:hypothetical protein
VGRAMAVKSESSPCAMPWRPPAVQPSLHIGGGANSSSSTCLTPIKWSTGEVFKNKGREKEILNGIEEIPEVSMASKELIQYIWHHQALFTVVTC